MDTKGTSSTPTANKKIEEFDLVFLGGGTPRRGRPHLRAAFTEGANVQLSSAILPNRYVKERQTFL